MVFGVGIRRGPVETELHRTHTDYDADNRAVYMFDGSAGTKPCFKLYGIYDFCDETGSPLVQSFRSTM